MNYPDGNLSTEAYINGLRECDDTVLKSVYTEFRQPVVQAITTSGGSEAAGKAFFRTAIIEAVRSIRTGDFQTGVPFVLQIKNLALAHYRDWLTEREQPLPETESNPDEQDMAIEIPDSATLRNTRQKIDAWKKGERTDDEDYPLWEKLRVVEHKLEEGEVAKPKSNFARNLFIVFALLTVAWLMWLYVFRSKTPAEVYDDNFTLPESLIADLSMRYGPERGNDSVTARPNACEFYLRQADEFYKVKDHESAQAVLFEILEDSLAVCHSDALFYIGIIALEQEDPELALECFSKIEDLEHFGEDIYWYQALAFVKLAEKNPFFRDKATRAVERARSNTQDSLRRIQAEKMLKHLAE